MRVRPRLGAGRSSPEQRQNPRNSHYRCSGRGGPVSRRGVHQPNAAGAASGLIATDPGRSALIVPPRPPPGYDRLLIVRRVPQVGFCTLRPADSFPLIQRWYAFKPEPRLSHRYDRTCAVSIQGSSANGLLADFRSVGRTASRSDWSFSRWIGLPLDGDTHRNPCSMQRLRTLSNEYGEIASVACPGHHRIYRESERCRRAKTR